MNKKYKSSKKKQKPEYSRHQHGIRLKKKYGQHFLRDEKIIQDMLDAVKLSSTSSIFEIGCGDGFLTQALCKTDAARIRVYEIDHEWAAYVRELIDDPRLEILETNILEVSPAAFAEHAPWTILANLPYNITFPILRLLVSLGDNLKEGVVMIQEEVAQKLIAQSGRGHGPIALYFQHVFDFTPLTRIPPSAFVPPPQVNSRLIYLKPRHDAPEIPQEMEFWEFVKRCFSQPRRTMRNNLAVYPQYHAVLPEDHNVRAEALGFDDFLGMWKKYLANKL